MGNMESPFPIKDLLYHNWVFHSKLNKILIVSYLGNEHHIMVSEMFEVNIGY